VTPTATPTVSTEQGIYATAFGAVGDAIFAGDSLAHAKDGVLSGTTFTSATAPCVTGRAGESIFVDGAGAAGVLYKGTVVGCSGTNWTVTPTAGTSVSTAAWVIGFDNTVALQAWIDALTTDTLTTDGYLPVGVYLHRGLNFTSLNNGWHIRGTGRFQSVLLDIAPTNSPPVAHDFSGTPSYGLAENIGFWNGVTAQEAGTGAVNVLVGRVSALLSPSDNTWNNDSFRTYGSSNYNFVGYGMEQTSFINDYWCFDDQTTPIAQLYLSAVNSPSFASPYVSLVSAPTSTTVTNIMGGASCIGTNGGAGIIFDTKNGADVSDVSQVGLLGPWYFRPSAANDIAIKDTGSSGSGQTDNVDLKDVRFEPQTTSNQLMVIGGNLTNSKIDGGAWNLVSPPNTKTIISLNTCGAVKIAGLNRSTPDHTPWISCTTQIAPNSFEGLAATTDITVPVPATVATQEESIDVGYHNEEGVWWWVNDVISSNNSTGTNVVPTATFADGTHCGVSGGILTASSTNYMHITMGSTVDTTVCPITYGTAADCPGTSSYCGATDEDTFQSLKCVGGQTGLTITAATDMHGDHVDVWNMCY